MALSAHVPPWLVPANFLQSATAGSQVGEALARLQLARQQLALQMMGRGGGGGGGLTERDKLERDKFEYQKQQDEKLNAALPEYERMKALGWGEETAWNRSGLGALDETGALRKRVLGEVPGAPKDEHVGNMLVRPNEQGGYDVVFNPDSESVSEIDKARYNNALRSRREAIAGLSDPWKKKGADLLNKQLEDAQSIISEIEGKYLKQTEQNTGGIPKLTGLGGGSPTNAAPKRLRYNPLTGQFE